MDLQALNPEQREAVEHVAGPTLVLAGAGSGKTRVLTYKIAHLVSQGVKPWRILAVTFTNKAAREMVERVEHLLEIPSRDLWIGTFHGICVRIIRREADRWGFRRDFTIYDRDDQASVVKKVLREMGLKAEGPYTPSRIIGVIGKAKNGGVSPDTFLEFVTGPDAPFLEKVYRRYEALLREAGAFDFDDLLLVPVDKFGKDPGCLAEWQNRFSYILVDEYQDTNIVQYRLMKLLSGNAGNVTVVGDDDQSIYSWRGADIRNILEFEREFRNVKTVRLEKNYRSTATILNAANAVVAHNESRMSKRLWTDGPEGQKVMLFECPDDREEANRVISSIEHERTENGFRLRDFVILYRTNAQSRLFEDVLRRRGLPYVIVGGTRFYERMEIKDILAYLRIVANPGDSVSFERAITTPRRGIGPKTIEMIEQFAARNHVTLLDALARAGEYLGGVTGKKTSEFYAILQTAAEMRAEKKKLDEIAQAIIERTGYELYLREEYQENADDRVENINELVTAMGEFVCETGEDPLSSYLAEVSLVADVDTWDENSEAVTLMTLHSAKGLEFSSVYIAGVEYGLFPLSRALESDAELEEERRLFYVGITRAKKLLHVSYAQNRLRYGSFGGGASLFIDELPKELIDFELVRSFHAPPKQRAEKPRKKIWDFEDYSQEIPEHAEEGAFGVGDFVLHPSFGRGRITEASGSGDALILTILFGAKKKKIMAKFAKLKRA
ncbi:UvrD-helicase domain-containing protein [bacterium]|nr:UvrD-helicase domain-containing protein [bacterium]